MMRRNAEEDFPIRGIRVQLPFVGFRCPPERFVHLKDTCRFLLRRHFSLQVDEDLERLGNRLRIPIVFGHQDVRDLTKVTRSGSVHITVRPLSSGKPANLQTTLPLRSMM